jgi:hypothetical protein
VSLLTVEAHGFRPVDRIPRRNGSAWESRHFLGERSIGALKSLTPLSPGPPSPGESCVSSVLCSASRKGAALEQYLFEINLLGSSVSSLKVSLFLVTTGHLSLL